MNYHTKSLLLIAALFASTPLLAQFSLKGEFRTRTEYRDGYSKLLPEDSKPVGTVQARTRLVAAFKKDNISTNITLQNFRYFGENKFSNPENNTIGLLEGWAKYHFSDRMGLKVGRQFLSYDEGILFWKRNWNKGATHDLVMFQYDDKEKGFKLDLATGMNNAGNVNFLDDYTTDAKYLTILYASKQTKNFRISLTNVWSVMQEPEVVDATGNVISGGAGHYKGKNTVGPFIEVKPDQSNLKATFTYYYQFGKNAKTLADVNAYYFSTKVAYKMGKVTPQLGYCIYSGTDAGATQDNTFDILYGGRHITLGSMDNFLNIPKAGIRDLFVNIGIKGSNKLSYNLVVHQFSLDKKFADSGEMLEGSLGNELDFMAKYVVSDQFWLRGGYSALLPTDTMRKLKIKGQDNRFAQWAWISLYFTPTFL